MKKFVFIFFLFFILLSGSAWKQAASILFCTESFRDAVYKAREHDQLIFIYVGSENCDICERLKRVFTNQQVADYYNEHFVSIKIDPENVRNNVRLTNWGVNKVPTMIFMDKRKKIVYKTDGYKQAHEMLFMADSVLNALDEKAIKQEDK
jgi:thioredoxin-related protein